MTNEQLSDLLPQPKANWGRRLLIGGAAAIAIMGAGAAAFAAGDGPAHWRGKMMRGFMEYRAEQVLTDIGADATQKEKIKALFTSTFDQIRPERGQHKQMREEIAKILEAPTIDRNAIEALRAKHVAEMEAKSKIIAKAVGDAAEILTPEQRKKLVDELADMGPGRGPDMDPE